LFAFNFHATQSYTDVTIPVPKAGVYTVALCSDDFCFGGDGRVAHMDYASRRMWGKARVSLYLPARTAVVLRMP
jgi:hypothetical protein